MDDRLETYIDEWDEDDNMNMIVSLSMLQNLLNKGKPDKGLVNIMLSAKLMGVIRIYMSYLEDEIMSKYELEA